MSLSIPEAAGDGMQSAAAPAGSPTCGPNECVAYGPYERLCPACAAARGGARPEVTCPSSDGAKPEKSPAAASMIPAYLSALAGLYRELGGHWLREPERQAWREKMARELEQMGSIFEQPVHYTAVRPHEKDLEWGDGPASCVRVESATVAPADVALAFLRCSRFELPGCPDRAATCAELAVLMMGLHQNPEAPFPMECSPFCGSVAGALAAWGTIAEELAAMAREWTVTWGPAASVYSREVLMLMGSGRPGQPGRVSMPDAVPVARSPVPASELEAAGAIIVKLRGEATAQFERAEATGLELARIRGAALPENLQPIERVHASVEERRAAYGVQPRDGFDAHKDRGTLLDAVRALKAELGFLRSEHAHCNQIMLQRDRFEEQVGDMAAQAGCQDEFTSSHNHASCVDEAEDAPRWQQELEQLRRKAFADNGSEMPMTEHRLMAQLFDLRNLADCIKSGKGGAVMPDGLAELLDLQPAAGWIVARVLEGNAVLTRATSHDKSMRPATDVLGECDTYGNSLCLGTRVRGS